MHHRVATELALAAQGEVLQRPFKVGMEMEISVGTLWEEEDKEIMGFKFAAAEG